MNERLKTVLMWAIALIIVASCGMSAIVALQAGNTMLTSAFNGTMSAIFQNATNAMASPTPT